MTNQQAPVALRLAEELEHDPGINRPSVVAELRRLHAENAALQQGYDAARMEIDGLRDRVQELGEMLRENRNRRIVELEAQLEAIGAGGVEPLRRRECLHQIAEPAPAGEYPPLPEPDATTVGLGAVWNRHSMRAYVDAARALWAQAAPQQEAQERCPSCRNGDIYACTCPFPTSRNTAPHAAPAAQGDGHSTACLYQYALARLGIADSKEMRVIFWDAHEALKWDDKTDSYLPPVIDDDCAICGAARSQAKEGA